MTRLGYGAAALFSLLTWLALASCATQGDVGKYTKALEVLL